jgi:hypothetical protein
MRNRLNAAASNPKATRLSQIPGNQVIQIMIRKVTMRPIRAHRTTSSPRWILACSIHRMNYLVASRGK